MNFWDYRFIHTFLIWTEVLFIQEVSGVYISLFLDKDELKMALQARQFTGSFEKRATGLETRPLDPEASEPTRKPPRLNERREEQAL